MSLPANVGYGRVTGRLIRALLDSTSDPDNEPDGIPIVNATVTFTASVPRVVDATAIPPVMIFLDPITVRTDNDGVLVSPDKTEGVTLVATDDPDLNPTGWTYLVTVKGTGVPSMSWSITVPEGSTQDLATAIPVPSSPGSQLAAWQAVVAEIMGGTDGLEALVDQATASAGVAQAAASTASTARDQAQEARSGAESAAASADAARDQAATSATTLNTWFLRGSGSPLGVVTPASAGVQYVDLAATNGARIWISTGNANTSWRVVEGDTGLRDVTSFLTFPSVVTIEKAFLSRVGQLCTFSIRNMTLSAAYSGVLALGIPAGFKTSDSNVRYYNGKARIDVYQNGDGWLTDTASSSFVYMTWVTRNAWPTTLPGTPA